MTQTTPYLYFENISQAVKEIPQESIVSRTVYRDDGLKAIIFAFAPGQELSEHTAAVPAIVQILEGDCRVTLGGDVFEARPGFWTRMPANLPHSIFAHTPVKMLLLMMSDGKEGG
jgi:quercetin dioxygenase-like cupin family protein